MRVIEMGTALTRGIRDGGIIPCGKHFPGHGAADKDSHWVLPIVRKSLEELEAVELPPFIHAIRNGVESIMTAHVRFTALDANLPATLSAKIVTGLLRHQLGYESLVFSDDMEMKAISDNYSANEAAALAVGAGVDMLLFCHELQSAVEAVEFLCQQAEQDAALRVQIEKSHQRIDALKKRCLKSFTGVPDDELVGQIARLNHRRMVEEIQGNL
jgi:beta-N-acetylhexosaminidase